MLQSTGRLDQGQNCGPVEWSTRVMINPHLSVIACASSSVTPFDRDDPTDDQQRRKEWVGAVVLTLTCNGHLLYLDRTQ